MFGLWVKNSIPTKEGWYRVKIDGEETTGLFIRYDGKYRWLGCNSYYKDPKEVEWMPASYYTTGDVISDGLYECPRRAAI